MSSNKYYSAWKNSNNQKKPDILSNDRNSNILNGIIDKHNIRNNQPMIFGFNNSCYVIGNGYAVLMPVKNNIFYK